MDCYGYPSSLITSIGNSQLSYSSITINTTSPLTGGTTLSLGSSMTLDLDEISKSKISGTGEWDLTEIPTITNSKLQNSSVTFTVQTPLSITTTSVSLGNSTMLSIDTSFADFDETIDRDFTGTITINTLMIGGFTTDNLSLYVEGDCKVQGDLEITGDVSFDSAVVFSDDAIFQSVGGNKILCLDSSNYLASVTLGNNLTFSNGTLNVSGGSAFDPSDDQTITGNWQFQTTLKIKNGYSITSDTAGDYTGVGRICFSNLEPDHLSVSKASLMYDANYSYPSEVGNRPKTYCRLNEDYFGNSDWRGGSSNVGGLAFYENSGALIDNLVEQGVYSALLTTTNIPNFVGSVQKLAIRGDWFTGTGYATINDNYSFMVGSGLSKDGNSNVVANSLFNGDVDVHEGDLTIRDGEFYCNNYAQFDNSVTMDELDVITSANICSTLIERDNDNNLTIANELMEKKIIFQNHVGGSLFEIDYNSIIIQTPYFVISNFSGNGDKLLGVNNYGVAEDITVGSNLTLANGILSSSQDLTNIDTNSITLNEYTTNQWTISTTQNVFKIQSMGSSSGGGEQFYLSQGTASSRHWQYVIIHDCFILDIVNKKLILGENAWDSSDVDLYVQGKSKFDDDIQLNGTLTFINTTQTVINSTSISLTSVTQDKALTLGTGGLMGTMDIKVPLAKTWLMFNLSSSYKSMYPVQSAISHDIPSQRYISPLKMKLEKFCVYLDDKTPSSGQAIEIKMIVGNTTYTYRYTFGNLIVNATNTKSSGWSLALELSGSGILVLNINDVLDIQIATSSGNLQNSEVQLDCLFSYDITDGFF